MPRQQQQQHQRRGRRRRRPPRPVHARRSRADPRIHPVEPDWLLYIAQTPVLAERVPDGRDPCRDDFPAWARRVFERAWQPDSTGQAHDDAVAAIRAAIAAGESELTRHREGVAPSPGAVSGASEWTVAREAGTRIWRATWQVAAWPSVRLHEAVSIRAVRRYEVRGPSSGGDAR